MLLLGVVAAAGFVAGRGLSADRSAGEAQTKNPLVTAPVRRGPLRDLVVGSAAVQPARRIAVSAPTLGEGLRPVVTATFARRGERVGAGDVLTAVANRPVIALPGFVPVYRAMHRGVTGTDISQLQLALEGLGFSVGGDLPGIYSAGTARAVAEMYSNRGFTAVDAVGGEISSARAAKAAIPLGEVAFIEGLPATVVSAAVRRGALVGDGPMITLATGSPRLIGNIPSVDVPKIRRGDRARIQFNSRASLRARLGPIASGGSRADGSPQSQNRAPVRETRLTLVPQSPIRAGWLGQSGRLIVLTGRAGPASLLVPVTAILQGADRRTWVRVVDGTSLREVNVKVQIVVGGNAAVRPTNGELEPGDRVVVTNPGAQG